MSKEKNGDAVLDEIAAKVDALGFNETDPNHMKCMDTVKSQDTINTLINQLRIMFEEYTNMQHERDYFEELNEALFRCLELSEGATVLESDDAEENTGENSGENPGENSGETAAESSGKAAEADKKEAEIDTKQTEDVQMEEPTSEENGGEEENKNGAGKRKTTMKSEELLGINELLRREIFELRHEVEVLKETFRDYLNSEELSQESTEEDTEDDEAHLPECAQCRGGEYPGMSIESEDYQYLENDQVEIVDESDSD